MAWLAGYSKRKPITITGGASGAQTNFQIKLTVTYDGDMQSDFDDLRFTQADGQTLIDAWLETKTDDASATVWAEFPTTPANTITQTYYMYYGKVVANYWDGAATFLFFDDFEDYTIGSIDGQGSWSGNHEVNTSQAHKGSKSIGKSFTDVIGDTWHDISQIKDFIAVMYMKKTSASDGYSRIQFYEDATRIGDFRAVDGWGFTDKFTWSDGGYQTVGSVTVDTWQKMKVTVRSDNTITAEANGTYNGNLENNMVDGCNKIRIHTRLEDTFFYQDLIYFRKYASNPPTYAFGAEESAPTGAAPTSVFIGPFGGPFGGPIQ